MVLEDVYYTKFIEKNNRIIGEFSMSIVLILGFINNPVELQFK